MSVIDSINKRTMASAEAVRDYSIRDDLVPSERAALDAIAPEARGRPILDIGVGGGRTVKALREMSPDYLGVDYTKPMVEAARRRFPGVRFEHADARDMSFLKEGSVFLAVFSCNGIGMVGHEDRLAIMREVHRVLTPGGAFLFSTHNQRCEDHTAGFRFPEFHRSRNPAKLIVRSARFAKSTATRFLNRARFNRHSHRTPEYSIINDVFYDYATMMYYISLEAQRRQLEEIGFRSEAPAFDLAGRLIHSDTTDNTLTFLARK